MGLLYVFYPVYLLPHASVNISDMTTVGVVALSVRTLLWQSHRGLAGYRSLKATS